MENLKYSIYFDIKRFLSKSKRVRSRCFIIFNIDMINKKFKFVSSKRIKNFNDCKRPILLINKKIYLNYFDIKNLNYLSWYLKYKSKFKKRIFKRFLKSFKKNDPFILNKQLKKFKRERSKKKRRENFVKFLKLKKKLISYKIFLGKFYKNKLILRKNFSSIFF